MQLQELRPDGDFTGLNSQDSSCHDGGLTSTLTGMDHEIVRFVAAATHLALIKPRHLIMKNKPFFLISTFPPKYVSVNSYYKTTDDKKY